MDNFSATRFLRDHHKTLRGLLAQSEAAPARASEMEASVVGELLDELDLHCQFEEATLYPALHDSGDRAAEGLIENSWSDHDELKRVVAEARELLGESRHGEVRDRLEAIRSLFETHLETEESEVFALADKLLGEEDQARMRQRIEELRASHPRQIQAPNGGEQSRKSA